MRTLVNPSMPNSSLKDGWYDLGLAYAAANSHSEAIAAFRKQIELDPNHSTRMATWRWSCRRRGKTDEAIAAYRKQMETAPYEKTTHKNLGLLLAQLGGMPTRGRNWKRPPRFLRMTRKRRWRWRRCMGGWERMRKAQELMKGLTGSVGGDSGQDIFAAALKNDIDPAQTENDAQQVLYDIGGQFDSGELDRLGPSAFSSMRLVALAWSRMGWRNFSAAKIWQRWQFLTSAWLLSQSGTVGNRLGQVLEKQGQAEKARHMYALAVAAGGSTNEVQDSRAAHLSQQHKREMAAVMSASRECNH